MTFADIITRIRDIAGRVPEEIQADVHKVADDVTTAVEGAVDTEVKAVAPSLEPELAIMLPEFVAYLEAQAAKYTAAASAAKSHIA